MNVSQVAQHALGVETSPYKIEEALKTLAIEVFKNSEEFKHNPRFINMKNGMLDIEEFDINNLLEHKPEYFSRIQLNAKLDLKAKTPRWEKFLDEVFAGDKEKAKTLQSYFGYCLLPDCRYQRCLFMIGSGSNGKSVTIDVLTALLGKDNVCSLPLQHMGERFLIGQLRDKLVNIASELASSKPIETANFKDAVSGGLIMADQKHGKPFTFYPVAKHIFSMNELPKITDKTYGFQRRPIVIKFNERFEGEKADTSLTQKLVEEVDGILLWVLEGLMMCLEKDDIYISETVKRETETTIRQSNPVMLFVDESCVLAEQAHVKPPSLYREYVEWCKEGNNRPLARNRFYDQIMMQYPAVTRKTLRGIDDAKNERVFHGIGIMIERPA